MQSGADTLHRRSRRLPHEGRTNEVVQVSATGRIEVQGPGNGVEYPRRGNDPPALFEPGVVVGRHPGKQCDLFTAQSGDSANSPVGG